MQGTRTSFRSREDAIHFAEKQGMLSNTVSLELSLHYMTGWDYYVYVKPWRKTSCLLTQHYFIQAATYGQEDSTQELC